MADARRDSPESILARLIHDIPELAKCEGDVRHAAIIIKECYEASGKMLVCGNGGSAADCEHIVGELMKSFRFKRSVNNVFVEAYRKTNGLEVPSWLEGCLPAIALVSHAAFMTAFSNDVSSVGVFAQQVYGLGREGDVLIAISTSGNSENIVEAVRVANAVGMKVVALTGAHDSSLASLATIAIKVPATETYRIQEYHLPIYHCLCAMTEAVFFGENR